MDTNPSEVSKVGHRMREVREKAGFSQSKCAVKLNLSDRAYKNYELGKREPSLATAVLFSSKFGVDLNWLAFGNKLRPHDDAVIDTATECGAAAYAIATEGGVSSLSAKKFAKFFRYALKQSLSKGTAPGEEARAVFDLMRDDDE